MKLSFGRWWAVGVSHRAHVLFKRACLVKGKVASSRFAGIDTVKASYGAVAQEA